MKNVIIIGTAHTYQFTDQNTLLIEDGTFGSLLSEVLKGFEIVAVAEEMSPTALANKGALDSTVRQFAEMHGLPHRYADPNLEERTILGIKSGDVIQVEAFFSDDEVTPAEVEARIQQSYRIREQCWLDQLLQFDYWPVLFVCGANHVAEFTNLLHRSEIDVTVYAYDWPDRIE